MERRRRRWWTVTVTAVSTLIVGAALISALFQLAVRTVPGYRAELGDKLGKLLGRPVQIGDLRLTWRGFYPSLDLDRIVLEPTESAPEPIRADRLRLAFSLPRLLARNYMPERVDLIGAELAATRSADGRIRVRGLPQAPGGDGTATLRSLERLADLRLQNCVLVYSDESLQLSEYRFDLTRGILLERDGGFTLDLDVGLPAAMGRSLSLHADLDGKLSEPADWSGPWVAYWYLRGFSDGALARRLLVDDAHLAIERARLRLKGEMQASKVDGFDAELDTGPINAGLGDAAIYVLNSVAIAVHIQRQGAGWTAQTERLAIDGARGAWPQSAAQLSYTPAQDGFDLGLSADFLRLDDLLPWLGLVRGVPEKIAALHDAGGDLERFSLRWHYTAGGERYTVAANLRDVRLPAAQRKAGFAHLSGELSADESGGRLSLRELPLELELPHAFESAVSFDSVSGLLSWQRQGQDWTLRLPDLRWRLLGSEGQGAITLSLPAEGSPLLDLAAKFAARDATRFKPYMPLHWGPHLRAWLDRGILAARVPSGELTIKGPLAHFPFDKTGDGVFKLDVDVADGSLLFDAQWPTLERLDAQLAFRNNSLTIEGQDGALLGARVQQVSGRFADLHEGLLHVDGEVGGDLSRLYRVVEATPLKHLLAALVDHTRAAGPAAVEVQLDIPTHQPNEVTAAGTVKLDDVSLQYEALSEPIRGISGEVKFGPQGVSSEALQGQFYELPLRARIVAVTPHLSRLSTQFRYAPRADGSGVSALVPDWIRPQLSGESTWTAELDLGGEADSSLRLSTDLVGTAVKFPPPLAKPAEQASPLGLGFSGDRKIPLRIGVNYRDRLTADLQFAKARENGRDVLALGSAALVLGGGPAVASTPGVVIQGRAAQLDLAAWAAALSAFGGGERVGLLRSAELSIDQPIVAGQALLATDVKYTPQPGGWQAELSGNGAQGGLVWRSADGGKLTAQLQHLAFAYHGSENRDAARAPPKPPTNPAKLPVLDLDCGALIVSGLNFGHARLLTQRIPGGQQSVELKLAGGALDFDGSGQWWRRDGGSGANLKFHLESTAAADVLKALDYAPSLSAKDAKFDGDLLWAPNPAGVQLSLARGHLQVDIRNGQLRTIEPGAGRVLGLLNFYTLPRRLTLNFRDVVGQGLAFDTIGGGFDLGDGDAVTSDLAIKGPSLRMDVRGRVGLAARDYDQHITVYPDVSSGVTLGALLLGGPIGGALALIAQQVLDKPLDQVTQLSYHLGGTWDNPEIKRGDGGEAKEAQPAGGEAKPAQPAEPAKP